MTRQNDTARNERDANAQLAASVPVCTRRRMPCGAAGGRCDHSDGCSVERPPLVKGDRAAIVFAGVLLAMFWGGIALLVRSCTR